MWPQRSIRKGLVAALCLALVAGSTHAESSGLRLRRDCLAAFAIEDPQHNKEHKVEIPGKDLPGIDKVSGLVDRMSVTYESIFAFFFVVVITSAPLYLAWAGEDGERSRTNLISAATVLVLLVGGIFAFTNILKFNSAHFPDVRCLTIVESVYLLAQMITTVGYGDITPAYPRGQVVMGFYVLCCLMLIADMVGQVSTIVVGRVEQYAEDLAKKATYRFAATASPDEDGKPVKMWEKPAIPLMPIAASGLTLTIFVVGGVLFWHFFPGEGKTWLQAIYMSIITLSTVGFGAFTATTEGGKVFGAFWMIFGVAALVSFVSTFTELMLKVKEREKFSMAKVAAHMKSQLEKVKKTRDGRVDRASFTRFALLQVGKADEELLRSIDSEFDRLCTSDDGLVTTAKIEEEEFPKDA